MIIDKFLIVWDTFIITLSSANLSVIPIEMKIRAFENLILLSVDLLHNQNYNPLPLKLKSINTLVHTFKCCYKIPCYILLFFSIVMVLILKVKEYNSIFSLL